MGANTPEEKMRTRDLAWLSREQQDISRRNTYLRLLIPPLLAVIFFIMCFLILPRDRILILGGLMIAYFIPPSGKESIIPIGIGLGIPWWLMALTLTLLDVITCLFMIMNFAIILGFPGWAPGSKRRPPRGGSFLAEHPWIARWRVPGVAFLLMLLLLRYTGGGGDRGGTDSRPYSRGDIPCCRNRSGGREPCVCSGIRTDLAAHPGKPGPWSCFCNCGNSCDGPPHYPFTPAIFN